MTEHTETGTAPLQPPRALRRRQSRPPTIDDVAAASGVSRGTVSRVLNGGHYVSPKAQEAVRRAMQRTGYVVNNNARSLATRRSNYVAFVVSEPQELLFEDPNFGVLMRACTRALSENDIGMVLMVAGDHKERERVSRYARGGYVDGLLLISAHTGDEMLQDFDRAELPRVCCGRPLGHEGAIPYVAADDRGGARMMTQHLLDAGRRRVATITGPLDTPGGADRLAGYRDVLGEAATPDLVVSSPGFTYAGGEQAMAELLRQAPDLDAVFVAADLMAAGALATLRRAGRSVPGDVAVGGFDDSPVAMTTEPALTTIRQPLARVGREMVQQLLRQFDGEDVEPLVLPTELVLRHSA